MKQTQRSQLHRSPEYGSHQLNVIYDILDAGFLAHVGFQVNGQVFVIPTLYGREEDRLYLHGSAASRMLRELGMRVPACLNVTLVDGMVLARSAFEHTMNYRSVVLFGTCRKVEHPAQKTRALRTISEHVLAGRWDDVRGPTDKELKGTTVLEFMVEEASAKVREGPPKDLECDYDLPIWAGVLPLKLEAKTPIPDPRLAENIETPEYLLRYRR